MSPFDVEVHAEITVSPTQLEVVRSAAAAALANQGLEEGSACTILLTGDERIRQLNRDYLSSDKVTDVLSFPAGEPTPGADDYLGDIAISLMSAGRQATAGGHSLEAELQLLTVHAVLHLLGYDHDTAAGKESMWSVQAQILADLGSEITEPKNV